MFPELEKILKTFTESGGKITIKWDLVSSLTFAAALGFFMFLGVLAGRRI